MFSKTVTELTSILGREGTWVQDHRISKCCLEALTDSLYLSEGSGQLAHPTYQ